MKRLAIVLFAIAFLPLYAVAEDQKSDEPASPKAVESKLAFDEAMKKAEADFAKAQAIAAAHHSDRLQEAMKLALKAEKPDLDEINRIDAKIKELATLEPATTPRVSGIRLVKAIYCSDDDRVDKDFSEICRKKLSVAGGNIGPADLLDIAPFKHKYLLLHLSVNGQDFYCSLIDVGSTYFGRKCPAKLAARPSAKP